ncbi:MAG: phosphopyruvate hydratase [Nanoarchaeota archaeon]|nr:phosphopyruvate hydratase [Nanoarchaeota archaeon]
MPLITAIKAREILDSRGYPTIEATVYTKNGKGVASVPAGASTGKYEALELRDGGKQYSGKGVQKAVHTITHIIAPALVGKDCRRQREIDSLMLQLDGTETKRKLGANAILAVSIACTRAAAKAQQRCLFDYLQILTGRKCTIPRPYVNIINGGRHADTYLDIQEYMVVPRLKTFRNNIRAASEIYHTLQQQLQKKYGKGATTVGDEGGFAPLAVTKTTQALDMITTAIARSGYTGKVDLALDCAASEFFRKGKYHLDGKAMTAGQLQKYYRALITKYKIISIEDPFEQNDFASFARLRQESGIQIVGDDITVTNPKRIAMAVRHGSCNCLLLKVNQIGTVTEALDAVRLAFKNNWKVMVSHRSGETEDTFIADLAVALGCGQIKAGAPCRGERIVKYNRLLKIEQELQDGSWKK